MTKLTKSKNYIFDYRLTWFASLLPSSLLCWATRWTSVLLWRLRAGQHTHFRLDWPPPTGTETAADFRTANKLTLTSLCYLASRKEPKTSKIIFSQKSQNSSCPWKISFGNFGQSEWWLSFQMGLGFPDGQAAQPQQPQQPAASAFIPLHFRPLPVPSSHLNLEFYAGFNYFTYSHDLVS